MRGNYITIKEASEILGVSPLTLRNWDNNGKFPATRHPMNNYRVYKIEDLEKLIDNIETGVAPPIRNTVEEARKLMVRHLKDWEEIDSMEDTANTPPTNVPNPSPANISYPILPDQE